MIECSNEVVILIGVIKTFLNVVKFVLPVALIVLCILDIFKIVISKNEDDIKKYRKYIYNRIFNCVLLFLIPTIVFLLFDVLFGKQDINNVGNVKDCWNSVK